MKLIQIALLALVLAGASYFLQADARLDGADEGYYWYGVVHTAQGQVPIRDFEAYDPGRYYWGAACVLLSGGGILAVRLGASLFQALCLFCGLSALSRVVKSRVALFGVGVVCTAWMFLNFRYFDAGLPLAAIFFAVRLVEEPSLRRHFEAGAAAALALFFGLNHGLYFLGAFCALSIFCEWKKILPTPVRARLFFLYGLLSGSLPLLGMWIFVPGFFGAYWGRFFEFGGFFLKGMANYQAKIPWPWTLSWKEIVLPGAELWIRALQFSSLWAQGLSFLIVILFYGVSTLILFRIKKETILSNPLFPASVFVGLFYAHHIFARSDLSHLGEGIFPMIVGFLSVLLFFSAPRRKAGVWVFAVSFSILTVLAPLSVSNLFFKAFVPPDAVVRYSIGKDNICLLKIEAAFLDEVKQVLDQHVPPDEPILFAPLLTTLYPVFGKTSPVWEIYFFRPASEALENKLISQMEEGRVKWAMITENNPADNRPEVQFAASHPKLYAYLKKNFEALPARLPVGYSFLKRVKNP